MAIVHNTLKNPGKKNLKEILVTIRLIASTDGEAAGFHPGGDYSIEGTYTATTDATGKWSIDLEPNVNFQPANTFYEVTEKIPNRPPVVNYFVVPNTAGPFHLYDILVTPPGALSSTHESKTVTHAASSISFTPAGSIAATNVQAAIVEAVTEAAALAHNHAGVYEPAGSIAAHEADTTNIHGIVDTAQLATLNTAQTFTANKTFQAAGAATVVAASRVAGDTQDRFHVLADGKMEWGPGGDVLDVSFLRSAAGALDLVSASGAAAVLRVNSRASSGPGISAQIALEADPSGGAYIFQGSPLYSGWAGPKALTVLNYSTAPIGFFIGGSGNPRFWLDPSGLAYLRGTPAQIANRLELQDSAGTAGLSVKPDYSLLWTGVEAVPYSGGIQFRNPSATNRTGLRVMPRGPMTGLTAVVELFGTDFIADPANFERISLQANSINGFSLTTDASGSGTRRGLTLDTGTLGFYGTAPIAKPTGVAVTAAGIHAALVSLGLIAA